MTEDDARQWISDRFDAASCQRLSRFVEMVVEETGRQNLISPSTIPSVWTRHALDSAQLLPHVGPWSTWLDIGTGGGFPGIVIACLSNQAVTMVEPRKLRATFLQRCVDELGMADRCTVLASKVEAVTGAFDVVSARAVAGIGQLISAAIATTTNNTRWLLPRGRYDPAELNALRHKWAFMFHVKHSITAEGSVIVILERVRAK